MAVVAIFLANFLPCTEVHGAAERPSICGCGARREWCHLVRLGSEGFTGVLAKVDDVLCKQVAKQKSLKAIAPLMKKAGIFINSSKIARPPTRSARTR